MSRGDERLGRSHHETAILRAHVSSRAIGSYETSINCGNDLLDRGSSAGKFEDPRQHLGSRINGSATPSHYFCFQFATMELTAYLGWQDPAVRIRVGQTYPP